MQCWQTEDLHIEKVYPYPFGRGKSLKNLHNTPNLPIVSIL